MLAHGLAEVIHTYIHKNNMITPLWPIYGLPLLHEANYYMIRLFQSGVFTYDPYNPLVTLTYPHFTLMHTPS